MISKVVFDYTLIQPHLTKIWGGVNNTPGLSRHVWLIRFLAFAGIFLFAAPQNGVCQTLRFGSLAVPLSATKTSSPALHVRTASGVRYGHLVSGTAPGRLTFKTSAGIVYSLVATCAAQHFFNNGTCTNCANGCSTSQACTPALGAGCTAMTTNSGIQTRSAACTNPANNVLPMQCAAFGACTGGTCSTCASGYTLYGGACIIQSGNECLSFGTGNGAGTTSTIAADYTAGIYTWNGQEHGLPNSWLTRTIRDDLNALGGTGRGDYGSTALDAGNIQRCIYPTFWVQSAISSTTGTRPNSGNPVITTSGNGNAGHCWCRVKRRSDNRNGPWIYHYNITANAAGRCPSRCASITYDGQVPGFGPALLTGF